MRDLPSTELSAAKRSELIASAITPRGGGYPDWVFETLRQRCGLAHRPATFEIGPGTGIATRPLLRFGANPLVAIEPDARLAAFLRKIIPDDELTVTVTSFEDVDLNEGSFDLGASATAF